MTIQFLACVLVEGYPNIGLAPDPFPEYLGWLAGGDRYGPYSGDCCFQVDELMATPFRLGPKQLLDLGVLRDVPPDQVQVLIGAIDQSDPPPLATDELGSIFDDVFPFNPEIADSLLRLVISLTRIERERDLSADDILDGLLSGVSNSAKPWTEPEVERWQAVEPELRRLLDHPRIWQVAKALDLSYDYAHLLGQVKIVSDIRPVFDRDATRLEAAVVSFTLRLRYDDVQGNHDISLAMNQNDIKSLLEECQRALRKAQIAAETMNASARIRTIIIGADDLSEGETDAAH